jgi:hypothetical protein
MEPGVVVAVLGAALAVLVALGHKSEPERAPIPVRVDDDPDGVTRR